MDILKIKTMLALGLSGAVSISANAAEIPEHTHQPTADILSVSSPDVRVTVYDGIATVIGTANSDTEAKAMESELLEVPGIDYVINLVTWQ
jgi:osmotically-inducible protein OsmY